MMRATIRTPMRTLRPALSAVTSSASLVVALSGCAQLFGLDETSGPAGDASGTSAHVTITHESIGATVIDSPVDAAVTHDTVTFLVPDAAAAQGYRRIPGTVGAQGTWTGEVAGEIPLVDFTVDGDRHLWIFPSQDLEVVSPRLEHPNPQPAPTGATLTLAVGVPGGIGGGGAESFTLYTVGAWSMQGLVDPAMATSLTQVVSYDASTPIGPPALAKLVPADAVLVLRRRAQVGGSVPLDGVFQTSLDQTGADTLTGTLTTTAVDQMVSAQIDPNALATRYTAVRPAVGGLAMGWACVASPGFQRGNVAGPTLNDGGIAITDTSIQAPYGNPFSSLGWTELLFYNTYETRTVALPGGQMLGLSAGLQSIVPPGTGLALDLPAGLPQAISLGTTPLATDNMMVTIDPTAYVPVSMIADRTANTFVQIAVFEITTPDATTVKTAQVIEVASNDPGKLVLPPDVFVVGHTYVLEAITRQGGWAHVATGDLATTAPPFHIGYSYSGVFTVAP